MNRPYLASLRAREEGIKNLIFIHGSALDLPFPDEEFDVVNCCGAIYLFPDVPRALGEIYRVLNSGGRFTASGFKRSGSYRLSEIITEQRAKRTGVRHYLPQELEAICKHAGLTNIECHYSKRRWMVISATKQAVTDSPKMMPPTGVV